MENEDVQNIEQAESIKPARKKIRIDWNYVICLGVVLLVATMLVMTIVAMSSRDTRSDVDVTTDVSTESIAETTIVPETTEVIHNPEPTIEETTPVSETPSAPVSEEENSNGELSELEMLARVIYQEAGGDSHCDECRRRVADVVLNRVAHKQFPDTMYEVLTAKSQYGRFHWTGIVWADRASDPTEAHAVDRAYQIAEEVLNGQHSSLYEEGYIWQAEFVQGTDGFWCCGHYFGRS